MNEKHFEIKGFSELSEVIENLGREFGFEKLIGLSYLIFPSAPQSSVTVDLYAEQNDLSESHVFLKVNKSDASPDGYGVAYIGKLDFSWVTGSGHTVTIEGSWREDFDGHEGDEPPTFTLTLGGESGKFYSKVKRVLRREYERTFVDAYWGSPDNIKTFVLPAYVRAEVGDWVLCNGESNIQKVSRIFRAVKPEIVHAVYQNVSEREGRDRWSTMEISEAENVLLNPI
ncbi:hypothetical protein [Shouchella clausii]|uniref:Uncharacterized protein n=1 Tax=Shouchella clausii TaxID=79880 RepID=A0A268NVZ5_SHOCL|nr:hypothetical protein [Shouchella clausii]PAE87644.1 hypothetical protein CHH72_17310 [Shouchella clausii]